MERLKKERCMARTLFTKAKNNLEEKIQTTDVTTADMKTAFKYLELKAEVLFSVDERIKEQWLDTENLNEDEFMADNISVETYRYEWEQLKVRYDTGFSKYSQDNISIKRLNLSNKSEALSGGRNVSNKDVSIKSKHGHKQGCRSTCSSEACHSVKRHFRLPKIELRKFDGNVKSWIGFWGQFKKIDNDETMDEEDKFQYLFQSTVPGSPARDLVESFPPSGENYKKAIEQMKSRFAREDLLIEIYVRELLNLVLSQAKENASNTLGQLYDKIETQLQALESLGVTSEKYAAMLFPLVESALPEDILRAWERSQNLIEKSNLNKLLQFLKREIETEERIQIASNGLFVGDSSLSSFDESPKLPTAAYLLSAEGKDTKRTNTCIWCDKSSHSSLECYKANKMSFDARKEMLMKKGGCYICLKTGHNSRRCKNFTKCLVCSKRHTILMCPDINKPCQNDRNRETRNNDEHSSQILMSQKSGGTTLLQTLMVKIVNGDKSMMVRPFLDSGAQKSYIRRDIIQQLNLKAIDKETLGHCHFGGIDTRKEEYHVHEFTVKSLDNQFDLSMTALDKNRICGYIPRVNMKDEILLQLQKNNIVLSDFGDNTPDIGLLIGANYSGLLFTNCFLQLYNNVVALKTKLGWTIQGPMINACSTVTTVGLTNLQLTDLWELETIGIKDRADLPSRGCNAKTLLEKRWWERLVRSVKELLRRNLGKTTISYEELVTLLCDCEALINSRPLTYIADKYKKTAEILKDSFYVDNCITSLIQKIWNLKYKWDEKLPDDLCKVWLKHIHLLKGCRISLHFDGGVWCLVFCVYVKTQKVGGCCKPI